MAADALMAGQTPTPRRPPLTKGESKAATPRKSPSKVPTPRAQSAPKERPSAPAAALKETIGKVKGGLAFSRMLEGSKAPQTRGDPNNIKVGVRCRPLSNTEKGLNESEIVQFSGNSICVTNPMPAAGEEPDHIFAYDHLYAQPELGMLQSRYAQLAGASGGSSQEDPSFVEGRSPAQRFSVRLDERP